MTENSVFRSPIVGRHLFGPGPCNPYTEAHLALSLPLLGHLDPAFIEAMDATSEMLREVWGTRNQRTLPLSATGSAGMEAAFVNTIRPGDVVVVAVNRSEEHTSELQSRGHLVCRLLLETKKQTK